MTGKRGPVAGSEQAKHGGQAVRDKHGPAFFAQIGKKGGQAMKQRGPAYFAEIGRKGGESTRQKYGSELYARAGKAGGAAKKRGNKEQRGAAHVCRGPLLASLARPRNRPGSGTPHRGN